MNFYMFMQAMSYLNITIEKYSWKMRVQLRFFWRRQIYLPIMPILMQNMFKVYYFNTPTHHLTHQGLKLPTVASVE